MAEPFTLDHLHTWMADLKLTLDTGEPFEQLEPFQAQIVEDIFAGFREIWVLIPESNAKTTLMALVALYMGDNAPSPWIPIGAASREQAEIMFGQAAGFVERSTRAKKRFRVYEGYRKIKCIRTGGRGIKVYAADVRTGDGVIPYPIAFLDELHRQDDLRLYRLWKGKLGKRGGKIVTISTAGEPGSEFEEQRETIRAKADTRDYDGPCHLRAVGKQLVYHEWMVPDAKKARDLELVKHANPLAMITADYLQEKLESNTLDFGEDWLRLTCNIPTRSSLAAIPESDWDALQTDERIPAGAPVSVGADFAWMVDCTAIVPLWVRDAEFHLFGDPEILTPPRDGTMLDVDDVKEAFRLIHERNPIELVVMDKTNAADVAQWVAEELDAVVIDRSQKNEFQIADYDAWMKGMREGWLHHTGHPEFRRHVLNAIARRVPGDKRRFDRPSTSRNTKAGRQEKRVIDALTAAAMVYSEVAGRVREPVVAWA